VLIKYTSVNSGIFHNLDYSSILYFYFLFQIIFDQSIKVPFDMRSSLYSSYFSFVVRFIHFMPLYFVELHDAPGSFLLLKKSLSSFFKRMLPETKIR
jgi:hypothetical protein